MLGSALGDPAVYAAANKLQAAAVTHALPIYHINREAFWHDPYPDLQTLRHTAPVAMVPELGAILITRRDDIFKYEKMIEIFSSDQPEGLNTFH